MIFFKHVWILMVMQKPSLSACEVTEAGWIKYVPNTTQRLRDGLGSTRCVPSTPPRPPRLADISSREPPGTAVPPFALSTPLFIIDVSLCHSQSFYFFEVRKNASTPGI